ncbi:MAG: hypothetical protein RL385_5163 [Pseudomonadota bacterium]|jgi:hypothetical protein
MIFSIIITGALLSLIGYALLQHRQFPIVGRALPLICLFGIYVAWFPEATTSVAQLVGVGRGTDLMLYVWVLASLMLILVLHLKLVALGRRFTELARAIAIAGATPPAIAPREESPQQPSN